MKLETDRLALVLRTTAEVRAWVDSLDAATRAEISPAWLAQLEAAPASGDPWTHGFDMRERALGVAVGSCAFKGPPDADGAVEIAYGVDPAHQGRGHATEAARALVEFALADPRVRVVRAHTRPDGAASMRVLQKCGFANVGEVIDPEDGPVWRWEIAAKPA
jgi:RimJ/RimL family protein N-acetyltransferase